MNNCLYNFVTVYGIATKFNTTMRTNTVLLCTKFQDNQITHLRFMTIFVVWQKEEKQNKQQQKYDREKKTKRLNQFSKVHISDTLGTI